MLSRLKFVALIGILAGPVLAYMGWKEKTKLSRIEADGVTVPAQIVGGETNRGRRGSKSYKMEVSYQPKEGGSPIKKTFSVKQKYVESHVQENNITDDAAEVRYLPSDPKESVLVGGSTDSTAMLPLGGGWALVGLLTGGVLALRKK